VSTAATFVSAAVTSIAISRFVEPAEYGRASVVLSIWGFLVIPLTWCSAVVARFGPVELERRGRISQTLGTRLVFAVPAVILSGLAIPFVIVPWTGWSGVLVALTYAFLFVTIVSDLGRWGGSVVQGFRTLTVANLLTRGLPALVVVAPLFVSFTVRAEHLLAAWVVSAGVGGAFVLYMLRSLLGLDRPDRELLRAMWRYIAPALIGVPATSLIMWIDPIVLSRFVSQAEVGHYQLGYLIMNVSALGASSMTAVLSPELVRACARGDRNKLFLFVGWYQPRLVQVFGLLAFAAACVAEPLVVLVVGPKYAPSGQIAALLCVAAGFQMATSTLHTVVNATDGQAAVQTTAVLQALLNVGGDLVLGSRWGAQGIALANVLTWMVGGLSLSVLLRRKAAIRLRSWAVLTGVAPLIVLFVSSSPAPWSRLASAGALCAAAAAIAAGILRARGRVLSVDA
jgi:PST family polysaccharide transporter